MAALFSSPSLALQEMALLKIGDPRSSDPIFRTKDPHWVARSIENFPGLKTSSLERRIKNDLIYLHILDPKKFSEKLRDRTENPTLYQSYLEEVNELFSEIRINPAKIKKGENLYDKYFVGSKIDTARKIAKRAMLTQISSRWDRLSSTIFNEYSVENKAIANEITLDKMKENFFYDPHHPLYRDHRQDFFFEFQGSSVTVEKSNLKVAKVYISVDPRLDSNAIEDGAENIQADESSYLPKMPADDLKE